MSAGAAVAVGRQLVAEAADELRAATTDLASDEDVLAAVAACADAVRQLDEVVVTAVAQLARRGVFADRGYRTAAAALGDLVGWDRAEARRVVVAADAVRPRVALDGTPLPPTLPATAEAFASLRIGLRHVEVVARLLDGDAAGRLAPEVWAAAEEQLAVRAAECTPAELDRFGAELLAALDQDGPDPDEDPPAPVNELRLQRHRDGGGTITGRYESSELFDAVLTAVDALAAPRDNDDRRPSPQRNAEALADVCGYAAEHDAVPQTGGRRPVLTVLIRLEDLEARARAATLDFGGTLSPAALRALACDAAVVPVVLGGASQPLDVGRATRTIPDGLRRAVTARDRGCAFPGCDRPPSWCECHHCLEWEHDGETKIDNLVLLCKGHHRLIHASEWQVRIRDGHPEFLPPTWIDPHRRPRRKPLSPLLA